MGKFTVPGLSEKDGERVAEVLQERLSAYNDLHLTLKHIHWNVVGPNFIGGVHEMIDPRWNSCGPTPTMSPNVLQRWGGFAAGYARCDREASHLGRLLGGGA